MRGRARLRGATAVSEFSDADRELAATLDNLDDAEHYRKWIFDLVDDSLGARVLEVGAGHGTFTELVATGGRTVTATDLSPRCVAVLQERYGRQANVNVLRADIAGAAGFAPYDSVLMINVLEHIEDDSSALVELRRQLEPDGTLVLWVPAHMSLYSDFDRAIGHYRRYTKPELEKKLVDSGFVVERILYVNLVGALAWWVVAKKLHRVPTGKLGVSLYDTLFVPVVRRVESRVRVPAGQSVLAIARKVGA